MPCPTARLTPYDCLTLYDAPYSLQRALPSMARLTLYGAPYPL